jgi:hypothetical protein
MDIPIAVLRDVGRYRSAQALPGQALIFVVEDVGSVSPETFRQICICLALGQKRVGLGVVTPDVSSDVIENPSCLVLADAAPQTLLEPGRSRPLVGELLFPLRGRSDGKVTNRVLDVVLSRLLWPQIRHTGSGGHDHQS